MRELDLSSDELVGRLLSLSQSEPVCILDSCGVSHVGSHLLIAGIRPVDTVEVSDDPTKTLSLFDSYLGQEKACIFTLSYDLGLKLENIGKRKKEIQTLPEPDLFLAVFDGLVIHDYSTRTTFVDGDTRSIEQLLIDSPPLKIDKEHNATDVSSNFSRGKYLNAIEEIKKLIRSGDTYQTNLTQRLQVNLNDQQTPQQIFHRLRTQHPAPFAAFIQRNGSTVISASPERFVSATGETIETSPIKGTRRRGTDPEEDNALRNELLASEKDRAENTMIVDLLRNDLGRICEYGSVRVDKLCQLEEHPSLFHLVSTISGKLNCHTRPSDVIKAIFPCGSITGAPKHRTMQIIDQIETADRGLSMGAIGLSIPDSWDLDLGMQLSVAIRTMVIHDRIASFNVGGGIVIDSDPEKEYEESLLKAKALLTALGAELGNTTKAFGV